MNKRFLFQSNRLGWLLALTLCATAAATRADSLWRDDSVRPMFADKRASAVGDVVTIVVQESNTTSKDASTTSKKSSGVDANISSFLYGPSNSGFLTKGGKYPAMKFDNSSEFSGSGSVGTTEKIVARIAVRVVDVLPNRNLVIEGTRQTSFSGESQDVILRGTVRPEDIAANNVVYSYNVADVTIKFLSKGTVTDGQKKGWFSRVWDKVTPF